MPGVYERALGDAAADLRPKVRERYGVGPDDEVLGVGRGEMHVSRGTHVLPALYAMTARDMLFPEAGRDVPFTVETAAYETAGGHDAMTTRREFDFPRTRRRFDTVTVYDDRRDRLFDFLGRGGPLVTELHPRVDAGALVVEGGAQWLRRGDTYHRIPGALAATLEVTDRYDDRGERFHVDATVETPLAGHVLSYRGTFTQDTEALESVPASLRPVEDLWALPP
jgi:hypothetical protein